jgi:hypothetical protein
MDPTSLSAAFYNATSYLPSPADLLLAVPRLLLKAGSFAEHIDTALAKARSGGSIIAQPTIANVTNATVVTTFVHESAAAAVSAAKSTQNDVGVLQMLKNAASLFGYITSKWAIATLATALVLNRTYFYASSRIPLRLQRLHVRFALYILPTLLFVFQIRGLLRAVRCQTAPDWSEMQYGAPGRQLDTDFAGESGFMWQASSALLFWEPLEATCKAVGMLPSDDSSPRQSGSLALLWPLFLSLGFSHSIETLACALQGVRPLQEVGMTIFEHSLAFAEAESIVTKPFTHDPVQFFKPKTIFSPSGESILVSRTVLSQVANVPPEVLLISLISSFSHLTSNVLAMFGLRARYRLVTTGIWGMAYMASFAWSFSRLTTVVADVADFKTQVGVLRFPTVCIIGFIPHILTIIGISACGFIYILAFGVTVLSPPPARPGHARPTSLKERFSAAYSNLNANIHLSAITPLTINWREDFYTAILKLGFTILFAASEAVYLNEVLSIKVHPMTWVEKKRLQEHLARRRDFQPDPLVAIPHELFGETTISDVAGGTCGYAREQKKQTKPKAPNDVMAAGRDGGVGFQQRRGRFVYTYQFLSGIFRLLLAVLAKMLMRLLEKVRITYCPRWLRRLAGHSSSRHGVPFSKLRSFPSASGGFQAHSSPAWLFIDEKTRIQPSEDDDIEDFARQKLRGSGFYEDQGAEESEQYLGEYLYSWWKGGGTWGNVDSSGDYIPSQDDDATSVVSQSTTHTDADEWSDLSDGQRTPTQSWPSGSRETTPLPDNTIDLQQLSRLLDPKTREEREEARLLARHLQSPRIMTRSSFRKQIEREESRLLESSRTISLPEEEKQLEDYVLDRRSAAGHARGTSTGGPWNSGADGMGEEGPQCVVCQVSPRTVLVWPCGCLSLCDECRVGLASKNYTACVCCRTNVTSFSRLFVP